MGRGAARRAWRRRGEPVVGLWNRVVSVAGIAEREDLTVEPPRPETRNWRRKGLKRLDPRPESPRLGTGSGTTVAQNNSRRLSPDDRGEACVGDAAASRSETAPQKLEMIESAPGMASNKSKPQDLARGGTAAVGVAATAFHWPRPNLGSRVV